MARRSSNSGEYRCSLTLGEPDARLMCWIARSEYVYKEMVLLDKFFSRPGSVKCTAEYTTGGATVGFAVLFKDAPLREVRSPTYRRAARRRRGHGRGLRRRL